MNDISQPNNSNNIIVLKGLEGNQPTQLYGIQNFIAPHYSLAQTQWWLIFAAVVAVLLFKFINRWNQRHDG